jgi:hypothetical protein
MRIFSGASSGNGNDSGRSGNGNGNDSGRSGNGNGNDSGRSGNGNDSGSSTLMLGVLVGNLNRTATL